MAGNTPQERTKQVLEACKAMRQVITHKMLDPLECYECYAILLEVVKHMADFEDRQAQHDRDQRSATSEIAGSVGVMADLAESELVVRFQEAFKEALESGVTRDQALKVANALRTAALAAVAGQEPPDWVQDLMDNKDGDGNPN